jgi:hypothetical protein
MDFLGLKKKREREERKAEEIKRQEFICRFHFALDTHVGDVQPWQQKLVDSHLRILASTLNVADQRQEGLMLLPPAKSLEDQRKMAKDLSEASQVIKESKSAFWAAHKAAKEYGFAMKEKYKDYLSK